MKKNELDNLSKALSANKPEGKIEYVVGSPLTERTVVTEELKEVLGCADWQIKRRNAERARKIHRRIESRIKNLMLMSNGYYMSNEVFRLVLKSDKDMNNRYEILSQRKQNIERYIWRNA